MQFRALLFLSAFLVAVRPARAGATDSLAAATRLDMQSAGPRASFREHAPLALFGLGSLAVGGIFYGIHASLEYPGRPALPEERSRVRMAMAAAGITALSAGASYLWYTWRDEKETSPWPEVSGGVDAEGGVAASLTFPLSSLVRLAD